MTTFLSISFIVYLAIVLALEIGTTYTFFACFAFLFFVLLIVLWRRCSKRSIPIMQNTKWMCSKQNEHYSTFLLFFLCLSLTVVYWLAYLPGGFNLDAFGQWDQVHGLQPYNDWHPLLSTLLIKVILSVYDSFYFYILVQIILFSVSLTFLFKSLHDAGFSFKLLIIIACYIGISPAVGLNTICMTKDVQFTILVICLTTCFIRIISSNGGWFNNLWHLFALGLLSGMTMLVRHNGLFFVVPALLIIMGYYKSKIKQLLTVILIIAISIFMIKVPISLALNVTSHENVIGESVGIPMGIMGNALITDRKNLPTEVHVFLNEIAPDAEWEKHYVIGEWDSCKWEFGGTELLRNVSFQEILLHTYNTIKSCPQAAYISFRENTRIVWDIFQTRSFWIPEEYIAPNDVGITASTIPFFHNVTEHLKTISLLPILNITIWNTGLQMAVVLLVYCLNYKRIKKESVLLFLPLLIYNIGTMLLLAGPNQRYFYCNAVLFLPVLIMLLKEGKQHE